MVDKGLDSQFQVRLAPAKHASVLILFITDQKIIC